MGDGRVCDVDLEGEGFWQGGGGGGAVGEVGGAAAPDGSGGNG